MTWIVRIILAAAGLWVVEILVFEIPRDMWRNHKIYKRMRGGVRWWQ